MGQAGHKSAKMTLEAYQQTFPRDPETRAQVVAWLRGAGEDPPDAIHPTSMSGRPVRV
jgi:hypothetical protein